MEHKRRIFAECYGHFPLKVNGDWSCQAPIMTKKKHQVVHKTCTLYYKSSEGIQYLCVKNRPQRESLLIKHLCLHTFMFNDGNKLMFDVTGIKPGATYLEAHI